MSQHPASPRHDSKHGMSQKSPAESAQSAGHMSGRGATGWVRSEFTSSLIMLSIFGLTAAWVDRRARAAVSGRPAGVDGQCRRAVLEGRRCRSIGQAEQPVCDECAHKNNSTPTTPSVAIAPIKYPPSHLPVPEMPVNPQFSPAPLPHRTAPARQNHPSSSAAWQSCRPRFKRQQAGIGTATEANGRALGPRGRASSASSAW